MKNKIYISIFICLFNILSINAQSNYYYYYKGQNINLILDKAGVTISTLDNFEKSSISTLNLKDFIIETEKSTGQSKKYARIEFQTIPTDIEYFQKINLLNNNPKIIKAQPNFKTAQNVKIGMSNYFYVTLKNSDDLALLQSIAAQKNVQILNEIPYLPLCYTLICSKNTIGSTLDIANYFFETGYFKYAVPDFLSDDFTCSNDPMFGSLWGLNNTSNPNVDINACQAWNLSQGSGVKVAVLDTGIELTHIDLAANIYPVSYDSESGTSPSFVQTVSSQSFHGTHCAGTIAAVKDNNLQVVGVAPQSKLMSISNSLLATPNSRIKRGAGINWAWQNGADIINNSWGSGVMYDEITDAINSAITSGRNNKGTIVVFSTGNNNGPVSYPANTNPNIISVGAITANGSRSDFSNFGTQLDIVAPGSGILSTMLNNSTGSLDGTSMAAPHVAGVCALVLSANPCLTGQQVRDIIEQTSQKVGGYVYNITSGRPNGTWNEQMGYGLVDAFAAVQLALSSNSQILGSNAICNAENYTTPSTASSYNWAITEGASLVNMQGNGTANVTLTRIPNANGQVTLSLTTSGGSCGNVATTKTIWVGAPSFPKLLSYSNIPYNSTLQNGPYWNPTWLFNTTDPNDKVTEFIFKDLNNNLLASKGANNGVAEVSASELGMGHGSTLSFYVYPKNQCGEVVTIKRRILQFTLYYPTLCQYGIGSGCHMQRLSGVGDLKAFNIYPNPASDIINVELQQTENQEYITKYISGELFDLMGISILKIDIKNGKAKFSVAGLKKGIYVLRVYLSNEIETHQITVE